MNQTKDTRFWLTSFFEGQEQLKHQYKSLQSQIQNNGCFIVNMNNETVKIYTPELAVIFTSNELLASNMDTQEETLIDGLEYLKAYIDAYKEGEQYFETEYKVSADTLYGINAEQYVRDIHLNYFHVKHTGINNGWVYVKKQYPLILTYKAVKEFGYYSGIVSKVDEQVKKYSRLFATFDKCEHNLPPQQTENINWIELFNSIDIEQSKEPKVYITDTIEQKKNYFSEASFNLTIQYLTQFKKETWLLNKKRKLDYINSLRIEKPKAINSESPLFNQTVFEAQNNYFEFLTLYKSVLESAPSKQTEAETEQGTPIFTNNFDKITPIEIYKHFKAGLVEKGYLTEQELNQYLKAAFELKTIPETLFKIKDAPNKAAIEAVFYKYYKNVAGKIHGRQTQYAALLGDYFEGYKTTTVSSNFSKSVY